MAASAQPAAGPRSLSAVRLAPGEGIRIDGRLEEAAWAAIPPAGGFVQREPAPGEPASEETDVRVAYDASALYVAVTAYVRDPATLVRRLVRRDGFGEASDRVFIEIGSPADGRTAFSFGVNLAGARQDAVLFNDRNEGDLTWDAVWESAVREFREGERAGYVVEARIPFSQLRFDSRSVRDWEFNVQRDIAATGELTYWSPILPDADGYVSQFGRLQGLQGLRPPRRTEVVPYAAARLTRAPDTPGDPFYSANDVAPRVGLDASVGLTSGLTLNATVNPDFGQVELDPAVVNLSQYEVFFQERRPFFVEGVDAFAFGSTRGAGAFERPTFFYSRRIGQQPFALRDIYRDSLDVWAGGGERVLSVRDPETTPIAAATKVSGQVGDWTVGVLSALTLEESADFVTVDPVSLEEERGSAPVSPTASYTVARASRASRGGRTTVGAFGSAVVRDGSDPLLARFLSSTALVGGVDVETSTSDRAWTFSALASGSHVAGDSARIASLMLSEQRYFQRPDASPDDFDPASGRLGGYRTEVSVAKTGGGPNWRGALTLAATSPGFEVNDLGYQERADLLSANWSASYNMPNPSSPSLNYATVFASGVRAHNYGGDVVRTDVSLGTYLLFSNLWGAQLIGTVRPEVYDDRRTRGGFLSRRPADWQFSSYVGTNRTKRVYATLSMAGRREFGSPGAGASPEWTFTLRPRLALRPTDAITVTFEPDWVRSYNNDLYRGAELGAGGETFYRFLDYRYESLDLGIRWDLAFTPDLTLQLVTVPKVDALEFMEVRALREAGTFDLEPYDGAATPYADYTRLSIRGNAVLRWEWRPGSSLYVIWQQIRDDYADEFGGLGVWDDVPDVFGGDLTNVFLVKASYWFGL